jgi:hypothetical protein
VSRWSPPPRPSQADKRLQRERASGEDTAAPPAPAIPDAGRGGALAKSRSERATGLADAESAADHGAARGLALAAPTPRLGTAHGARETSWVSHTRFERRSERPDDVIRIRYDSRENLIASGVIRLPVPPRLDPFPASDHAGYVPDPPPQRH